MGDDLIAKEACRTRGGMGDQRLLLIHAADDLASFLRYPLGQLFTRGGRDATDQADGDGTSATGTDLQNDR
jgi:hypothetical protein